MSSRNDFRPAVVLSGVTNSMGVIRGLGMLGIPVVTVSDSPTDPASRSKYVDRHLVSPDPSKQEEQYLKFLLEQQALKGGLLIPTSDSTLVAAAKNRSALQEHYVVACPEWDIVERYIDKRTTYELALRAGVPSPKTIDIRAGQRSIGNVDILFPCLLKPRISHLFVQRFGTKMLVIENSDQLTSALEQVGDAELEVVIQEFIPGPDAEGANYNAYFWDGEPLVEFTAKKIRSAPPQTGSPRVLISKAIPEILEPGRKILREMSFRGFACTEFKRDPRDGVYKILEVNGRHNLSSALSVGCGINFPGIEYMHLMRGELPSPQKFKEGVYWVDLWRDLIFSFGSYSTERFRWIDYLRPYLGPCVYAALDAKDLAPFATELWAGARKRLLGEAKTKDAAKVV